MEVKKAGGHPEAGNAYRCHPSCFRLPPSRIPQPLCNPANSSPLWPAAVHSPFRAHVTDPLRGCQFPIVLGASPAFLWLKRGNARGLASTSSEMLGLLVTSSLAPPGTPGECQWILVPAILLDAKMESIALTKPMSLGLILTHPERLNLSLQSRSSVSTTVKPCLPFPILLTPTKVFTHSHSDTLI